MTATFLGKWRFHIPTIDFGILSTDGWAAYEHSPGLPIPGLGWCAWYTYDYYEGNTTGPYPPGKETNTALVLRADGQLCFLLNNGNYVGTTTLIYRSSKRWSRPGGSPSLDTTSII